jgi:hypothetical protein
MTLLLLYEMAAAPSADLRFWIDIEDSAGNKVGSGPITSATRWRSTKRLDRAGVFEFEMPAADLKGSAVAEKRIARCWGIRNGVLTEMGAGIIDKITVQPGRPSMMKVAGDDLLRELTYRSVGFLQVIDEDLRTPDTAYHFNGPSTYTALSNALDDNTGTYASVTLTTDDYLYIGDDAPFETIRVNVGATVNSTVARLSGQYWNGTAWTSMQISDGTAVANVPLAQDGDIDIERKANWATTAVNGVTRYWVRLAPNVALGAVHLVEIDVVQQVESTTALADIIALAPSGWSLDTVAGYGSTGSGVYARFAGEGVLSAFVKIASVLGEHFRAGSGRKIVWLRTATPASGLRAVQVASPIAAESATELAVITEIEKVTTSYDLATRVYPYGAGQGETRLTLAASTDTPPAGYSIDRAANWIRRDSAETTYGQIERYMQWKEIAPVSNTDADLAAAANALQQAATTWLTQNSAPYASYRLRVAKLDATLEPGQTIRVVYDEWSDDYHGIAIDANLVVLEATTEIDAKGVRTVAMQVATADRWPVDDPGQIVSQMQQATVFQVHPQLNANSYTTHYQPHIDADSGGSIRFRLGREVVQVSEVTLEFQIVPLISTVKTISTATTSNGGAATVTSTGESNHTHQYSVDHDTSGTQYPVKLEPNAGGTGIHRLVADMGGTSYTIDTGAGGTHAHDVVIANHTHSVTPTLTYGVYEASTAATFGIADLEFQVNGAGWLALASYAKDLGDGWYLLDITSMVSDATTFRPKQASNTVQLRRKTSGSFGSRAHCQVDTLLQVRNVIQSVAALG